MSKIRSQDALDYHKGKRPGKLEVVPTKPYSTQRDLSLAYSPGVAEPVKAISEDPDTAFQYTTKGNLVGVISNGTAILGLGNKGALASKPVMEGKGMLFKIFADIDVFDIEVDQEDPEKFIETVKAIAPTFGGINLEDIKAPEAFRIEARLKEELDIPVMHDDQHGTAIISGAALLNALKIAEKKIEDLRIVVMGAGAAAISCARIYMSMGASKDQFYMYDSKGLIVEGRENLDEVKGQFARKGEAIPLEEALEGADMLLGLSTGNVVSAEMVKSMADNPIVFAMANPDPEIPYDVATKARPDIIMATGRSDLPNQVNNVLGFPYIFRGALDVRARAINEEMKLAAVHALASLARDTVPESVLEAYGSRTITFGREMIIPKPLDPRLITEVATAVAKAAIDSGVARVTDMDWDLYERRLSERMGLDHKVLKGIAQRAGMGGKRVVFAEADSYTVLRAAQVARDEGVAKPILLGKRNKINDLMQRYNIELEDAPIIDPRSRNSKDRLEEYARAYFDLRSRKGVTHWEAQRTMQDRNYFAAMMVHRGEADAVISGITRKYADVIRPALEIIGKNEKVNTLAGMYMVITKKRGPLFFADTTVNFRPDAETLVDITLMADAAVKRLRLESRVAMLSYSNFGSSRTMEAREVSRAVELLHRHHPHIQVDGELQANFALNAELRDEYFPFSKLKGSSANVFIFPNLSAGNISYKLLQEATDAEVIGPMLLGTRKPFHVLQLGSSVREIVNMVRIAVVDAQTR